MDKLTELMHFGPPQNWGGAKLTNQCSSAPLQNVCIYANLGGVAEVHKFQIIIPHSLSFIEK